jgi:hypothetical protein
LFVVDAGVVVEPSEAVVAVAETSVVVEVRTHNVVELSSFFNPNDYAGVVRALCQQLDIFSCKEIENTSTRYAKQLQKSKKRRNDCGQRKAENRKRSTQNTKRSERDQRRRKL